MADQMLAAELRELHTKEEIKAKAADKGFSCASKFLKKSVIDLGLVDMVNMNCGGHDQRTLVDFKNDIIVALNESPRDVAQLAVQLGQTNIQGGGAADSNSDSGSGSDDESEAESDESETDSQVERREQREQEEQEINEGADYYDTGFDDRGRGATDNYELDC